MTERLFFTESDDANALIASDPMALLIGFVLDQQVTVQKAFSGPLAIRERVGSLDAATLATADLDSVFREKPAVHRFPGAMAQRVSELAAAVRDQYSGDASRIWSEASDSEELRVRLTALPGFGEQKARIFGALLGKQLGVQPEGWRAATSPFGEAGSYVSVADITDTESLDKVRAHKQALKAKARAKT